VEKNSINKLIEKYNFKLEETHISWVLIGKNTVYKIKKPVDFGFLDYSTLSKRLEFCQKEIELNSRLTKNMYLGISKIVLKNGDIDIDKEGEVIDYAVKMKKIPQDRMMNLLIEEDKIKPQYMENLAKIIANFHKKSKTDSYISNFGTVESNKQNTDENFEQTESGIGEYLTKFQYNTIKDYTNNFYTNNQILFQKRIKSKKIRECHGDMYSRNICIVSNDEIYIYDCIEFNERFRYSDVASDVAFLLMDLENYGRYDFSKIFLDNYIKYSNDNDMLNIIDFYKIYRAYVRGKIAFFMQNKAEANGYFDLAFGYLPKEYKPKLYIMCGLTGSGKSYIAEKLSNKIDAEIISSDETRKELMGMKPLDKDLSDFNQGIYSKDITKQVYQKMIDNAYKLAKNGKNVILDATYLLDEQRENVADSFKRLNIKPTIIFVDVDDKTALEHFKKRKKEKSASDGRYEIYQQQKKILEKPKKAINVKSDFYIENIL
jgi:aminoglycoside phosphotransferase family enzyme/predicted kinase